MKKIIACLFAILVIKISQAQNNKYIISFRNKGGNSFTLSNPSAYLSSKAILRRTNYSIQLDSTDLPITRAYIDSIVAAGNVTILNRSKWLNAITIETTDAAALTKITNFPFVQSFQTIAPRPIASPGNDKFPAGQHPTSSPAGKENNVLADVFKYGQSYDQIHIHNGEFLHNIGLRGQGMTITMHDAGFFEYLTLKAFDSARANGQILGVFDFVQNDSSVNEDHSHGMQCLSTIAANIPNQFVGSAPKASFYLFRTEDASTEYPVEEFNWVCAAERADSAGSDMISSSLGYNKFDAPFQNFDHSYADLDGNTAMITRGADLAAKKGILVVNSAGNEGATAWKYIITPADGDSVMAVGSVTSARWASGFTSLGPSADGQVKPDVASKGSGTTVQLPDNTIGTNNGTSFAAPNMAGLTACLWQGFREYNNMTIIDALRRSGSRANTPNDSIGYGIPDVKSATFILLKRFVTASVSLQNCNATINWKTKDLNTMKFEIERKNPASSGFVKVGEIFGTGNSFATQNHQFLDPIGGVNAGMITYRIRQIIDTSVAGFRADYIDTITVALNNKCDTITSVSPVSTGFEISINPNPVQTNLRVVFNTPNALRNLTLLIINSKGQTLKLVKLAKAPGKAVFELETSELPSGKYYLAIYDGEKFMTTREFIRL